MSTPTTATATLPPHYHNPHHHFPYYSANSSTSYRSAANQLLPPTSRVAPSYSTSTSSYAPSTATQTSSSTANGSSFSSGSSLARSHRQDLELPAILEHNNYTTMPASKARPANGSPDSRKRRRHSPVDWNKFYGGQPPKEIIVIDDSPGPDAAAVSVVPASQNLTNGNAASYGYANGVNGGPVAANTSAARHAPKRRKRDDDAPTGSGTRYDPVHHSRLNGSTTTPHQNGATPSASTISSSDRTNSAIHTTAATSLGSLSSNSQYDHDVQPGNKRKRTRQQVANEVKRRENAIIGHAYPSYHPPPQPPKKAADVHVRVIPDVSQPCHNSVCRRRPC